MTSKSWDTLDIDEPEEEYRDRDCPLCGSETAVRARLQNRVCESCGWEVHIGSSREKGEEERISELEELVGQLEERINELERQE